MRSISQSPPETRCAPTSGGAARAPKFTVDEYAELLAGENVFAWELVRGRVVATPERPAGHHWAVDALWAQIQGQLPAGYECVIDAALDLQLAPPKRPGTARRPDLVVIDTAELVAAELVGALPRAQDAILVVDVRSPGMTDADWAGRRADFTATAIPSDWVVEAAAPASLLACDLVADCVYRGSGVVTSRYETRRPFRMTIELDALVQPSQARRCIQPCVSGA
jgi:hypothetical protein